MPKPVRPRLVIYYAQADGVEPFVEWLNTLSNSFQDRVLRRLQRVQLGNLGDHKRVEGDVQELRLHFGAGYRVYFAEDGETIVVLLSGGDKATQRKDIKRAQRYWQDYLTDKEH